VAADFRRRTRRRDPTVTHCREYPVELRGLLFMLFIHIPRRCRRQDWLFGIMLVKKA